MLLGESTHYLTLTTVLTKTIRTIYNRNQAPTGEENNSQFKKKKKKKDW